MRNNSRIIKPLIYTDIQLLTLRLIGIYFHSNISLHNIDNIMNEHSHPDKDAITEDKTENKSLSALPFDKIVELVKAFTGK